MRLSIKWTIHKQNKWTFGPISFSLQSINVILISTNDIKPIAVFPRAYAFYVLELIKYTAIHINVKLTWHIYNCSDCPFSIRFYYFISVCATQRTAHGYGYQRCCFTILRLSFYVHICTCRRHRYNYPKIHPFSPLAPTIITAFPGPGNRTPIFIPSSWPTNLFKHYCYCNSFHILIYTRSTQCFGYFPIMLLFIHIILGLCSCLRVAPPPVRQRINLFAM